MKSQEMKEPAKVFYDFLFDYETLKYLFVYGYFWENDQEESLMANSSPKIRELVAILKDPVYGGCLGIPWWKYTKSGKNKKNDWKIVWRNHYRLMQNQWYLELYGCYGNFYSYYADQALKKCTRDERTYSRCGEEGQTCVYWRACMAAEEQRFFNELVGGLNKRDFYDWERSPLKKKMLLEYSDVIDRANRRLRKQAWFYDGGAGHPVFQDKQEYEGFLNMLRFFAEFAPLSVLGWNLYRRCGMEQQTNCFLIRNQPGDFGLEQEFLYRSLCAMTENRRILYGESEYIPVQLCYRDKDMYGLEAHLYLKARRQPGNLPEGQEEIRLSGGAYIVPGKRLEGWKNFRIACEAETEAEAETEQEFLVLFLYNDQTEYLVRRRSAGWKFAEVRTEHKKEVLVMEPAYPEMGEKWKQDLVTYHVRERDIPGFLWFVKSFGEFAVLVSGNRAVSEREARRMLPGRGSTMGSRSLLNPYNSSKLMEKAGGKLPPRYSELEWLDFVLAQYPGFCSIFLNDDCIKRIKTQIRQDHGSFDGWFRKEYFDFSTRVRDLEKRTVPKYRIIFRAVQNRQILAYEYRDHPVRIFAYALEYDVARHLSGRNREPLELMCYNLDEKRNIKILYKDIRTQNICESSAIHFSHLDKLYHILAYAVRCAAEEKTELAGAAGAQETKMIERLLNSIWKPDKRGGDNYNRCVRKQFKKPRRYSEEYRRIVKLADQAADQELADFIERVFAYWNRQYEGLDGQAADEDFEQKYLTFVLACCITAFGRLYSPKSKEMVEACLDGIGDEFIWRLICGEELDEVPNEIVFYNERMKNSEVSFRLKKGANDQIPFIHEMFRNYVCIRETSDAGDIRFTITYEKFYYRRVYMLLMALGDLAEEIEPPVAAAVISKRKKNRRDMYERTRTGCCSWED